MRQVLRDRPDSHEALKLLGILALNSGHALDATKILSRAIQLHSADAESHRLLALAFFSTNLPSEGEAALQEALRLKPSDPMANFNMGQRHLQAGQYDEARRRLEKAAKNLPREPAVLLELGVAYSKCGNAAKAAQKFRAVLKIQPDHRDAQSNLAGTQVEMNNVSEAISIYERLAEKHPGDARLQFNYGIALGLAGRDLDSIVAYEQALALNPRFPEAHINLSLAYTGRGNFEAALGHIRTARDDQPDNIYAMINEAQLLQQLGQSSEALEACRHIRSIDPDNTEVCGMEVALMHSLGRFDEARNLAGQFLADHPDAAWVICGLVMDRDYVISDEQIACLAATADDKGTERRLMARCRFALGNIYRDRGEPEKSFANYKKGNAIRDADCPWSAAEEETWFTSLTDTYSAAFFESRRDLGVDSERPIFIVGMPRSGTTLVEQIVATHPDAAGGGELSDIGNFIYSFRTQAGIERPYPACMNDLDEGSLRDMASRYLARLADVCGSSRRVTDKMPDNYQNLGFIAQLFPKARVIFCRRNPMANCFSIYQQNFSGYHPYAYDLSKLGRRYVSHERLVEHWQNVLPIPILEVAYEELVQDQEKHSRRILAFCGLEWDEKVLKFHETERSVRTVSRWQVRQPIYTSAVQGWQAYESFLDPLKNALGDAEQAP